MVINGRRNKPFGPGGNILGSLRLYSTFLPKLHGRLDRCAAGRGSAAAVQPDSAAAYVRSSSSITGVAFSQVASLALTRASTLRPRSLVLAR